MEVRYLLGSGETSQSPTATFSTKQMGSLLYSAVELPKVVQACLVEFDFVDDDGFLFSSDSDESDLDAIPDKMVVFVRGDICRTVLGERPFFFSAGGL